MIGENKIFLNHLMMNQVLQEWCERRFVTFNSIIDSVQYNEEEGYFEITFDEKKEVRKKK